MIKKWNDYIKHRADGISIPLLLFLLLFLNIKIIVKGLTLLIFLFVDRKEILKRKYYRHHYIWFYALMICVGLANLLINIRTVSSNYYPILIIGIFFWIMCIGAAVVTGIFVKKLSTSKLHHTISIYIIINCLATILQLLIAICESGSINPFTYQGMYQKYFINTGDMMTGITMDVSTTNAIISSFGVIYFLSKTKPFLMLLCVFTLAVTGSNFCFLLLSAILLLLFVFQSTKNQKSLIVICWIGILLFLVKISPQNNNYATNIIAGPVSQNKVQYKTINSTVKRDNYTTTDEIRKRIAQAYLDSISQLNQNKTKPEIFSGNDKNTLSNINIAAKPAIPKDNIHSAPFQRNKDTTDKQKSLLLFASQKIKETADYSEYQTKTKLPGKFFALKQTIQYLKENPMKIVSGAGVGNFSSKLAFRATALHINGGYPEKWAYTNPAFVKNHLALYLHFFSKDAEKHSLINSPDSAYNQLLGEYGVAGFTAFIILYLLYFIKKKGTKSYALPLLLILLGALFTGYWFEQLSIVILFEILFLLHIKENIERHE